ncbi:MAG: hypothetical protein PGN13_14175 [Patulibacter minatonensis]
MTRTASALRAFALAAVLALPVATTASAKDIAGGVSISQAPVSDSVLYPTVDGEVAKLRPDGTAAAPALAPDAVKKAIWAANKLIGKPYRYGGGHRRFNDTGYDCSGTVSFALKGGSLIKTPLDSSSFMTWEEAGEGEWITVYANPGHAFAVIAGLRLDTSASGDPSGNKGPRWRPALRTTKGFTATHPEGF